MIRVYLVDDDPMVRRGLKFILQATDDIEVVGEAGSGAEAIDQLPSLRPDVVVLDVRMPNVGGLQVAESILKAGHSQAILMMTAFDNESTVMEVLEAGAIGFLLKDAPPESVIQAIRDTSAGKVTLSPRHTRILLDAYTRDGQVNRRVEAQQALAGLSEREMEIAILVAQSLTNQEIARAMLLSTATVKTHLTKIFDELGIGNRVQLALLVREAELI